MRDVYVVGAGQTPFGAFPERSYRELFEEEVIAEMRGVVDDDGRLEGILTTTDFVGIVSKSQPKAETPVSEYMTTDVVTATAQTDIREVADTMVERGFHHMPVVDEDDGRVIGIVTTTDLTAYISTVQTPSP